MKISQKFKQVYQGLTAADNLKTGNNPKETLNAHYSRVNPTPVSLPEQICWSKSLALEIGIKFSKDWTEVLAGNKIFDGMHPVAARYGGHQFGHWAGQLGDGRAISLGILNNLEIQLKGAGLTPYSRSADGRAVLRSSLREYICSEAMHFLGVPTTRALSLVTTGESVPRDMFYDGNIKNESGAICTRVAPSFLRFGNFQILHANREKVQLQKLVDFTLKNFFKGKDLLQFFDELTFKTAFLITEWMRVGFVHGVMNTDNMSILGLTIDYGPYGFLDKFDLNWTPNTTDFAKRRYRFVHQGNIAYWNLAKLAESLGYLSPSLQSDLEEILKRYANYYQSSFEKMICAKLGLRIFDRRLFIDLYQILQDYKADMTLFYRRLMDVLQGKTINWLDCFYFCLEKNDLQKISNWISSWIKVLNVQGQDFSCALSMMDRANPIFIPRNYIVQLALDALEQGDQLPLRNLEEAIENPYKCCNQTANFFVKSPKWAFSRAGCSTLSCSS